MGFTLAGFDVGGPLRADASNGTTGVFISDGKGSRVYGDRDVSYSSSDY